MTMYASEIMLRVIDEIMSDEGDADANFQHLTAGSTDNHAAGAGGSVKDAART